MNQLEISGSPSYQMFGGTSIPDHIETTLSLTVQGRFKCEKCGCTGRVAISCLDESPVNCPECNSVIKSIDDQLKWS